MIAKGFVRRWWHDLRTASQLAVVRPAYAGGVRAAIATVAPLVFTRLLPAGGASWMSLAGLNGALIDRGGPYRMRAATMGALAAASAIAVLIGSLAAGHLALSVIVTFALAMLCGLARAWIDVGPGFGVTILITYAIALAIPADMNGAFVRAGFILAGGAWAMLLAIILWPIRPYRPVRLRVAECYRAIARYVEASVAELERGEPYDSPTLRQHLIAVRAAIEAARTALAVSRRGRSGETGRGERLLVLHEIADQVFAHVIALLEESDVALSAPDSGAARVMMATTLSGVAGTARDIASAIESETDVPRALVDWNGAALRPMSASMAEIVDRIADYAATATALAASINSGAPPPPGSEHIDVSEPPPEPVLFSLDAVLRPSPVVLHHALRVAIVTSTAVLITGLLGINHGYWVTLTAVVILQPFAAMTRAKAWQRVIGTIVGGMVAAGLSALFHSEIAVMVLIALFTMACVALLPINYGAYAVFGTPAFVLLAEASAGDWHLAGLRVVNTLIGGALALAGARFLWPGEEQSRLPELAAAALRANDELLARALTLVVSDASGDFGTLRDARRRVANAALEVEDSFQRLISEHHGPPEALEPVMAFLVLTRRIAASAASLAIAANDGGREPRVDIRAFERGAHDVLADLAGAVTAGRAPAPFPPVGTIAFPDATPAPLIHQKLVRVARQLKLIHDAVARWMSPGTEPDVQSQFPRSVRVPAMAIDPGRPRDE